MATHSVSMELELLDTVEAAKFIGFSVDYSDKLAQSRDRAHILQDRPRLAVVGSLSQD